MVDGKMVLRIARSATRRRLPAFLIHWEDEVAQEVAIIILSVERRGYNTTSLMLNQFVIEAIRRVFRSTKTSEWHAKSTVMEGAIERPTCDDISEIAWLRATCSEQWSSLTGMQQAAVCKWIEGVDQNYGSRTRGIWRLTNSPKTWKRSGRELAK